MKARVFYASPAYELTLVHTSIDQSLYDQFQDWYDNHFNDTVYVSFEPDGHLYYGIISSSPVVAYEQYKRYTVTIRIEGRKVS